MKNNIRIFVKRTRKLPIMTLQEAFSLQPSLSNANAVFTDIVGHEPTWSDMTDSNLQKYVDYLNRKGRIGNSQKSQMRIVLNRSSNDFPSKNYKDILSFKRKVEQKLPYLTLEQMERFANVEVVSDVELYVKCVFVIMMTTGAQFDDAILLTEDNIIGGNIFYTTKKGVEISIPAHKNAVKSIMLMKTLKPVELYITRIKVLKRVAKKAGLVDIVKTNKGKEIPLYEAISFQSATVSFATSLYIYGYKPEEIAILMGRKRRIAALNFIANYRKRNSKRTEFFTKD